MKWTFLIALTAGCASTDDLVPGTVDEDPDLPTLEVPGTLLHGELFGAPDDPLVVFLHGGPGSDYSGMLRQLDLVDADYQILAYDQRGGGLSRRHEAGAFGADELIEDLEVLIDRYSPDGKAILVGHSWGGQHAALAVQTLPERFDQVVLIEPGPWTDERLTEMGLTEVDMTAPHLNDAMWAEQVISPADHARLDLSFLGLMMGQLVDYRMSEDDVMPFERMGYVAWGDITGMSSGQPDFDFAEGLGDWHGTAHFIWGSANEIMTPDYREAQESAWPRTTTYLVDGVGHDVNWVAADEVNARILEVL